jgi:hypothetical protein
VWCYTVEEYGTKKQVESRGKIALNIINICVARLPRMEVKVLEQICNSLIESHVMTGMEIGD